MVFGPPNTPFYEFLKFIFLEMYIGVSRGVPWVPAGTTLGSGTHFHLRLGDASLSSENPQSARESTLSVS